MQSDTEFVGRVLTFVKLVDALIGVSALSVFKSQHPCYKCQILVSSLLQHIYIDLMKIYIFFSKPSTTYDIRPLLIRNR